MLDNPQLRPIGMYWIDDDEVWTEVWLQLIGDLWVGHYNCRSWDCPACVEFLPAGLRHPAADDTKHNVRFSQLLPSLGIEQDGGRLARVG